MKYMLTRILVFAFSIHLLSCSESVKPTNIVLIMVDDMGFSDLGMMGSTINTPNIDRLAEQGIFYNQFYNTGRCCPSRASLLTGLYAHNSGMGWMTASNLGYPGYTGDLNAQCITIAQVLQQNNYACYATGKWHLTHDKNMKADGPKHNWPLQRGFDKFFGHLTGGADYFKTRTMVWNNTMLDSLPEGFYLTTAVTDTTVSMIEHHFMNEKNQPFFFYIAYYAPHWPLHALEEDISKYRGSFLDGWDSLRVHKLNALTEAGIADSNSWSLSDRDTRVKPWAELSLDEQRIWDARMAVYAAQIDRMDQGVGRIINTLERFDALDNTVILFLSDNGGTDEGLSGTLKLDQIDRLGSRFPKHSYLRGWANASNTPFRMYKHYVHEGGISSPLIIHWPEQIRNNGSICNQVGHIIDIFPTILDITHTTYPATHAGKKLIPLQGSSLLGSIHGEIFSRGPIFFEHEANRAIRFDNWKLVSTAHSEPPYEGQWELYDLSADRSETVNLSGEYPEKVSELVKLWDQWARQNNVYPLDGRGWNDRIKAGTEPPRFE